MIEQGLLPGAVRCPGGCDNVATAKDRSKHSKKTASFAVARDTPLSELHRELGARFVEFAGYAMPVHYGEGILKEHAQTRNAAGLFDVSHMGQLRLSGVGSADFLERLMPVDVVDLPANRQAYALLTSDAGGILDDLMVANAGDYLFLVVNASRKQRDIEYLRKHLAGGCDLEVLEDRALVAIQGPRAAQAMARLAPACARLRFMQAAEMEASGIACFVTRSAYTGEDGFEISVASEYAEELARALLEDEAVAPAGLGARDTLRLEAGLCLYGQDMDEATTPVEAGLAWAISRSRRPGGARAGGYPGDRIIARQLKEGVSRRRVGIRPQGRAPVRDGVKLVDKRGREVGKITSGAFGATVGGPVAMGYVPAEISAPGTELDAVVRGKGLPVRVARLPFVEHRYYRG